MPPMANFLDRRALRKVLEAGTAIRRAEGNATDGTSTAYVVRAVKSPARAIMTIRALHAAAIAAFGGRIGRETPEGLAAAFPEPIDALRAALHALHAEDLTGEFLDVPACRIAVATGELRSVSGPTFYTDASGPALERAVRLVSRGEANSVVIENALFGRLRAQLHGYADIEIEEPRSGRMPGLGPLTTVCLKPLGLRPDREREYLAVDEKLRARKS
jgi:hypothetical protein